MIRSRLLFLSYFNFFYRSIWVMTHVWSSSDASMTSDSTGFQSCTSWTTPQIDRPHNRQYRGFLLHQYAPYSMLWHMRHHRFLTLIFNYITFFSTGSGFKTICVHCGVVLMDWQAEDDPWAEHLFWSPFCVYVRYIKGNRFIEQSGILRHAIYY
jgi:hypothetical protein